MVYRKCPYCDAYLDPGEICDCRYEAEQYDEDKKE